MHAEEVFNCHSDLFKKYRSKKVIILKDKCKIDSGSMKEDAGRMKNQTSLNAQTVLTTS